MEIQGGQLQENRYPQQGGGGYNFFLEKPNIDKDNYTTWLKSKFFFCFLFG